MNRAPEAPPECRASSGGVSKFLKQAVVVALLGTSCGDLGRNAPKYEIAKRAQCLQNMQVLAAEISNYHATSGIWPRALTDLGIATAPRCPSANSGRTRALGGGTYRWNPERLELSESAQNHSPERLGLRRLSNAPHFIKFHSEGGWYVQ